MRTCKEISKLVSESLDRELPLRDRMAMRMHLMMCSLCRTYSHQMRQLRSVLTTVSDVETPTEKTLSEEARRRIKQALKNEE
jgi:predicted anti-sigma-YlaC factor YlaD